MDHGGEADCSSLPERRLPRRGQGVGGFTSEDLDRTACIFLLNHGADARLYFLRNVMEPMTACIFLLIQ